MKFLFEHYLLYLPFIDIRFLIIQIYLHQFRHQISRFRLVTVVSSSVGCFRNWPTIKFAHTLQTLPYQVEQQPKGTFLLTSFAVFNNINKTFFPVRTISNIVSLPLSSAKSDQQVKNSPLTMAQSEYIYTNDTPGDYKIITLNR